MTREVDPSPESGIQILNDGDGLLFIGDPVQVNQYLAAHDLPSKQLDLKRLSPHLSTASGALQAGAAIAANSSHWVKLTEKSAKAYKHGQLMKGSTSGVSRAIVTKGGKTSHILEISGKSAGQFLTNPAVLSGAAGMMAQFAMQQAMDEITDYLKVIDAKVDNVLRAQKDAVIADMIGVEAMINEALTIRESVGRVSEVTWSKVQATASTIVRTQAYALLQLDSLAQGLESATSVSALASASKTASTTANEWLSVIARCVQLNDALAILELDRVLDGNPDELDHHRLGLRTARSLRLEKITQSTSRLLERLVTATETANAKVLMHPSSAKSVVLSTGQVGTAVVGFHEVLGIAGSHEHVAARHWLTAAGEVRDKAVETGSSGVRSAQRIGVATGAKAATVATEASKALADRAALVRRKTK